ncbi:MAG: DUF5681 domain-containing protein [Pseudomonadota bacterium]
MSRKTKGTARKISPELEMPSELDRQYKVLAERTIKTRQNGETKEMTGLEAVTTKQLATALAGSPHAQRQVLDGIRRSQEAHTREVAEEVKTWTWIKEDQERKFRTYREVHGCDPDLYPHPDDIIITEDVGVRIEGPLSKEEAWEFKRKQAFVEALLHQDALDRKREKRRHKTDFQPGDSYVTAIVMNRLLPMRYRMSDTALMFRRQHLLNQTIRELLKMTRKAWRKAGARLPRGAKTLQPEIMCDILDLCTELTKNQFASGSPENVSQSTIDAAVWRHLGKWVKTPNAED